MPAAAIPLKVPTTLATEYKEKVVPALIQSRGYKNVMEVPRIEKVVVNCCIGSSADTKVALEDAFNEVQMITGQRPVKTKSTKSIANFKLREGQEIGVKVTLRGAIMYEFLERLIRTALPRIRDFRGVSPRAFDGRGNYTLGVKDQTIFPEVELDKVKRNLGMDITIVTTARKNDEAKELLALFGMPFSDRKLTPQ
ncbi:MAG: 50S ribosomal protein L5 [Methylacidiphilales bacterium]|nr:50S ribosomal protein L5 [Candidatus Methylacidiphilales bacterium]